MSVFDWNKVIYLQKVKEAMKIGRDRLRMSNGEVRKFSSQKKRDNFERVAEAYKNGWRPNKKRKRK